MIPETFSSVSQYLTSFIDPLIEETHADLLSSMQMVSKAPLCEILSVQPVLKRNMPPNSYRITVKGMQNTRNDAEVYEPETGDLIAFTDVMRPKRISDLNRPKISYVIALLVWKPKRDFDEPSPEIDTRIVVSSKPLEFELNMQENKERRQRLYGVFLINMTTNKRIWTSLNMDEDKGNKSIIQKVLQPDSSVRFYIYILLLSKYEVTTACICMFKLVLIDKTFTCYRLGKNATSAALFQFRTRSQ